ncbi:MAG: TerC family protein [Proteobacteria bacterium]|nr:TerC family protein [Pseudomonadota bacterium]MBI3495722.1 TerC family protein [Pseudomonadota bacterium]
MLEALTPSSLYALATVIMIDVVLAGDNAVVVGMAAAGLEPRQRRRVILVGVAAATFLRLIFAGVATQLLHIIGLTLAGGILLLWVAWKMWRELRASPALDTAGPEAGEQPSPTSAKSFRQRVLQVIVADVSMSLDNVLAVAGAAGEHVWVLVAGLSVSVALMGVAANALANLLDRHRWIAWIGLALVLYVALAMIVEDSPHVWARIVGGS